MSTESDYICRLQGMISRLELEMARWQQIAIDATAMRLDDLPNTDRCKHRTGHEYCDLLNGTCDGYPRMLEICPIKDHWRSVAAEELNLQVTQEAGYVGRLEDEYLIAKKRLIAFHYRCKKGENMQDAVDTEAQAALTKIREGK